MSREFASERWLQRTGEDAGSATPKWRADSASQAEPAWPVGPESPARPLPVRTRSDRVRLGLTHGDHAAPGALPDPHQPEPTIPDSPSHLVIPIGPCHLLVFESGITRLISLPEHGETIIGTSERALVQLQSASVLPEHATILSVDGEAVLSVRERDAEVLVNGDRLSGSHVLTSGDVISVGDVMLGFHRNAARGSVRPAMDSDSFHRRVDEEIERALRYQSPIAVLVIEPGQNSAATMREVTDAVCRVVRRVDIVGITGRWELAVLFPETGQTAPIPARRVLEAVLAVSPAARGGLSTCPEDGCNTETLLVGARSAARAAQPAHVASVSSATTSFVLGDRNIIAVDPVMKSLFALLRQLAASDLPVLVHGETGVGKEIAAQALHAWSPRRNKRIVAINCAALPETLLESELFGHERGAFSGAVSAKPGLFERASGGTVFLDEVGECSPLTQAKLLRVLETHRVSRVGGLEERPVQVRIVSATNRSLEDEITAGRFRRDLLYRLNAAAVVVPPLRDRPLDIPILARRLLDEACAHLGRPSITITSSAMQRLALHTWPGNVRELKNVMDFVAAALEDRELVAAQLPERIAATVAPWMLPRAEGSVPLTRRFDTPPPVAREQAFRSIYDEIAELERCRMQEALAATGGARARAAELIKMPLRTFVTKLKTYGLGGTPSSALARRT